MTPPSVAEDDHGQPIPGGDNDDPLLCVDLAAQQPLWTGLPQEEPGPAEEQEVVLRRSEQLRRPPLRLCCDVGDQGGV